MVNQIIMISLSFYLFIYSITAQYLNIGQSLKIRLSQQNNCTKSILLSTQLLHNVNVAIQLQSAENAISSQMSITFSELSQSMRKKCNGIHFVVCVLHSYQYNSKQVIDIIIESTAQGEYIIFIHDIQYNELQLLKSVTVNFGNNFAKYYCISLKEQVKQIESVRIILVPNSVESYSYIYVQIKGNSVEIYQSVGLWKGAEGVFLSKQSINRGTVLYLWVIGQYNNSYNLSYQVLTKDHHDLVIPSQFYQFIDINKQKRYHIKCINMSDNGQIIVNIKIFSGEPEISFYLSSAMKYPFQQLKGKQYMSDVKYALTKRLLDGGEDVYFQVKSGRHRSVLQISIRNVSSNDVEMLVENSYNFYLIYGIRYLYLYLWGNQQFIQSYINITISVLYLIGKVKIGILMGSSSSLICLPKCQNSQFDEIKDIEYSIIGIKSIMVIRVQRKKINQSSILLIKLQNSTDTSMNEQLSIQYRIDGRMVDLRENYPLSEILQLGQTKRYRYRPLERYQQLKICVTVITGNISMLGSYSLQLGNGSSSMLGGRNCWYFEERAMGKWVYVAVYGVVRSKYSVSVQVEHNGSLAMIPILQTNQDIDYQVTIVAKNKYIFVLHPIYAHIRIFYTSSQPIDICFLDPVNLTCIQSTIKKMQVSGQLINLQPHNLSSTSKKICITNPSLTDNITFHIKYHSGSYDHCQQKLLSKVYQHEITNKNCFQFEISSIIGRNKKYYIMIKKQGYRGGFEVGVGVCGNVIIEKNRQRVIEVRGSQISKYCRNKEPTLELMVDMVGGVEQSVRIQYIVQGESQIIKLTPNIKYTDIAQISQSDPLRQFSISSQLQSTLIVSLKQSTFLQVPIFMSLYMSDSLSFIGDIYRNMVPFMGKGVGDEFSIDITLLPIDIKSICHQILPQSCTILAVIEPIRRIRVGESIEYSIEFKSASKEIKQYRAQSSVLGEVGDSDVYSFYPSSEQLQLNGTKYQAVVQISTHNEQCADIYVNKYDRPSRNESIFRYNSSINQFVIDSTAYMIQVSAYAPNCRYSLQIFTMKSSQNSHSHIVTVLHPEIQHDVSISQKQVRYLITEVRAETNIKILYMRKFGNVRMYAIEMDGQSEKKIIQNEKYLFSSQDFLIGERFPNMLNLPQSKNNTIYIVAIQGESKTQGSLLMHGGNYPMTVPHWKKIMYRLQEKQEAIIRYYTPKNSLKSGKLHINLLYGKIDIYSAFISDIGQKRQDIPISTALCCTEGKVNKIDFVSINSNPKFLEVRVINHPRQKDIAIWELSVQLSANQISSEDIDREALSRVELIRGRTTVIKSMISSKKYQIIISTSEKSLSSHNKQLNTLNSSQHVSQLKCIKPMVSQRSKGVISVTSTQIIMQRVLLINIEWLQYIFRQSYELLLELTINDQCMVDSLMIAVTPNLINRLTILMPFSWGYVINKRNFAVPSRGQFLIDIISCSGGVRVIQADSFVNLGKDNNGDDGDDVVDRYIKNQPHVFRVVPTQSVTYLQVHSPEAIIRYIYPDWENDVGIGYVKYKWDYIMYEINYEKLILFVQPVKNIVETKTSVVQSMYTVNIFEEFVSVGSSEQCQDAQKKTIYKRYLKTTERTPKIIQIPKHQLLPKTAGHPRNLYLFVHVRILLKTPEQHLESYKFVGPVQRIPVEVFEMGGLGNRIVVFGIVSIFVVIFGCVGLALGFIRYLIPLISRMKVYNAFIEEDENVGEQKRGQSVPPSSERNQRVSTEILVGKVDSQHKMCNLQK